ncbi:MAG TPA: response regulator [Phycisphaerales bacterium]|nr:response regulator [Phycisphaerales bacterium]
MPREPEPRLSGLRILIVEDMGLVAEELRWMVEEIGCRVVAVASRLERAKALARSEDINGVLLDLNLSGENSSPVAAILRERKIPYIIISGYEASGRHQDGAAAAHLKKPFDDDELAAVMLRAFGSGSSAAVLRGK